MGHPAFYLLVDASSTTVTEASVVDLGTVDSSAEKIVVFNTTAEPVVLYFGGQEMKYVFVPQVDAQKVCFHVPRGTTIGIKSLTTDASTGYVSINFLG